MGRTAWKQALGSALFALGIAGCGAVEDGDWVTEQQAEVVTIPPGSATGCPNSTGRFPIDPRTLTPVCPPYDNVVVFIAAHPDDETIGMAGAMREAVLAGKQVFLEVVTRGETSGVLAMLKDRKTHSWHSGSHGYSLTVTQFGDARHREVLASAATMGVKGIFVSTYPSGALTPAHVSERIAFWKQQNLPDLLLRGTAGPQDPGTAGGSPHVDHVAVWDALVAANMPESRGYLIYNYRHNASQRDVTTSLGDLCANKKSAHTAYKLWNPADGRYAVGFHSTPELFTNGASNCLEYYVRAPYTPPGGTPPDPAPMNIDTFTDDTLAGWSYFTSRTGSTAYRLARDTASGRPAASAKISGDFSPCSVSPCTSHSFGMRKTYDVIPGRAVTFAFDFRATSGYASSAVTNARIQFMNGQTGAILLSQVLAGGGSKDTGWLHREIEVPAMSMAGVSQLVIMLSLTDSWSTNWSQTVALDNAELRN